MKRLFTSAALFLCTLCTFAQFSGSGSGTSSDPYQVTTAYQLSQMRNFLNQEDVNFKLMNDIDLTDFIAEEYLSQGWLPIGVSSSPFKGSFDGNGKTISGFTINRTTSDYMGLFGYATNATIKKLTIQDCEVKAKGYFGALVGYATSCTISDCSITGNVTGTGVNVGGFCGLGSQSNFANCDYNGDVTGNGYVGGFVGRNIGNTSNCHVNGRITGSSNYVGGLCSYQNTGKTISLCSVNAVITVTNGNYIGGLFGHIESSSSVITSCFVSATITSTGNDVGGLVGNCYSSVVNNSYFVGNISGVNDVGGVIGDNSGGVFRFCYANAIVEGSSNVGGFCGYMQSGTLKSNATINSKISLNTSNATSTIGRIYGNKNSGTFGATGSAEENKALNTTAVYINNKLQTDITDSEQHGTGTSLSSLKRQDTYVALGWDFDAVWGIDEGSSFPYLLNNRNTQSQSITVTIPTTMTYGDALINLPSTTDQGQAVTWTSSDSNVLSVASGKLTPMKAGSATITATQAGDDSYSALTKEFHVTVNKATLRVTADDITIRQGQNIPTLTFTYDGFVYSDTPATLTTQPSATTQATADSPVGTYPITVSGGVSDKYKFVYYDGTLTIDEATTPGQDTNRMYCTDITARSGQQVVLPVEMVNDQVIAGFQIDLVLPEGVSVALTPKGKMMASLTDRMEDFTLSTKDLGNNTYRFIAMSLSGEDVSGEEGTVMEVTLNIDQTLEAGSYNILLKDIHMTQQLGVGDLLPADGTSLLTINNYILGDVNDDGVVSLADAVCIVSWLLENNPPVFIHEAADVNGDNMISVADAVAIVQRLLNGEFSANVSRFSTKRAAKLESTDVVSIPDVTVAADGDCRVSVMGNFTVDYYGFMIDMTLPETMEVDESRMALGIGAANTNIGLQHKKLASGNDRFIGFQSEMEPIELGENELLHFNVIIPDGTEPGTYPVNVGYIEVADIAGTSISIQPVTFNIIVTEKVDRRVILDENYTTAPAASDGEVNVLVRRTINAGEWSTIVLPFAMNGSQVEEAFGANVQMADFNDWEVTGEDADENTTEITVYFNLLNPIVEGMEANHPYLIKVDEPVKSFTTDNVVIVPDEAKVTFKHGSGKRALFGSMVGTYEAETLLGNYMLFLYKNQFAYSTGKTKMKAFRAYFDIDDVLQSFEDNYGQTNFCLMVDDVTTSISEFSKGKKEEKYAVYSISGVYLGEYRNTHELPNGVYIVNNHKVIVNK